VAVDAGLVTGRPPARRRIGPDGPGGDGDRQGPLRALTPPVAMGLALALLGFLAAAPTMTDNSLLTHLATGRLILERGSVPDVDPFSRVGGGEPWTVQSWLVATLYALVDRGAGSGGVRALHGLVGAGIGIGLWRLTDRADQVVTRLALAVLPLVLGIGLWSPRPLLFGLAALVALLLVARGDRPGWLLVPLLWLWANAHGSFPLALVVLGLVAAGSWVDHRRRPDRELRLLGWAALGIASAAIGPIGPRLLVFPLTVLARGDEMEGVVEWEAPSFESPWELLWLGLVLVGPLVAARRGAGWATLLPAGVFAAAGMLALRNIAPASIVLVAVLAPWLRGLYRSPGPGPARSGPVSRAVGVAMLVALVLVMATVVTRPGLDMTLYPEAEVDYLEERGLLPSADTVVVHREAVGNYLTWRFGDRAGVFMDDRFDFHPPEVIADHLALLEGDAPRAVLDRRQADVVLWQADSALAAWLEEADDWEVARRGERWVVACRVDSPAFARCRG
jgi:hypothetical protein